MNEDDLSQPERRACREVSKPASASLARIAHALAIGSLAISMVLTWATWRAPNAYAVTHENPLEQKLNQLGSLALGTLLFVAIEAWVTARQRSTAVEALREKEEQLRLLVEGVEDYAICML